MEKNGNVPNLAKGGGRYPPFGKKPNYFRLFLVKASLTHRWKQTTESTNTQARERILSPQHKQTAVKRYTGSQIIITLPI